MKRILGHPFTIWLLCSLLWVSLNLAFPMPHGTKASGGTTDCATAQTTGDDHVAAEWPAGQNYPTTTFAGPPPAQDMFGVLSCGDGRHVELQWLAGSPKAAFTWGNDYIGSTPKR